jgi:uncharacterized integral membrane protein
MRALLILAAIIVIAGGAFALQNNVPVTVTFLVWRFDSSLASVLTLAFVLGALAVALIAAAAWLRRSLRRAPPSDGAS